ncbi:hypothetical protein [Azospirillum argentinense]|nr:hypothetical protein [Azospirillum argentinense]
MDRVTAAVKAAFGGGDIDPRLSEAIARWIWGEEWRDELANLLADGSEAASVTTPVNGPGLAAFVMRLVADPRLPELRRNRIGDADPDCVLDEIRQQLRFESGLDFDADEADDIITLLIARSSNTSTRSDSRLRLAGRLLCDTDVSDAEIERVAASVTDASDEAIFEACAEGPLPTWDRVGAIVDAVTLNNDFTARGAVDDGFVERRDERIRAVMGRQLAPV